MSMISAQIDELRVMAQLEKSLERPAIANALRDAADTIWQLRCRLVDAEDRVRKSGELCKLCDLKAENARLRELVRDMWDFSCVIPDEPHTSKEELDYSVEVWKRMRELGIEVEP